LDLDEILQGGDDIEGDVDHSKMVYVYTSEVVQLLNQLVDLMKFCMEVMILNSTLMPYSLIS
jgi:hypothetical protein